MVRAASLNLGPRFFLMNFVAGLVAVGIGLERLRRRWRHLRCWELVSAGGEEPFKTTFLCFGLSAGQTPRSAWVGGAS